MTATRKFTDDEVLRLRHEFLASDDTISDVALAHSVSPAAVYDALTGVTWRHLPDAVDRSHLTGRWGPSSATQHWVSRANWPVVLRQFRKKRYSKVACIDAAMRRFHVPLDEATRLVNEHWTGHASETHG